MGVANGTTTASNGNASASTSTAGTAPRRVVPPQLNNSNGARLPFAHAGPSNYRVERGRQRNGQECEVIVIEDTPEGSAAPAGVTKKRKHEAANGYSSADNPYAGYDNKRAAPAAVGQKRKHGELSAREAYLPSQTTKKPKSGKSPAILPCDDKEGHFIPRNGEFLGGGRYVIRGLLGQGTFGKVVECEDLQKPNTLVAVKVIRAVQKYRDASKVEIKVLRRLREADPQNVHNCIHMMDCFDDRNHICIVTELLSVSVFDFLKANSYAPFPDRHIQSFARQLLDSVAFLHDLHLVHTDLKPENILLVDDSSHEGVRKQRPGQVANVPQRILDDSSIRLIDFGSATFAEDYHASVVSTRHYRAPEIILGLGWSYPCDVWSIGCILVELYTGEALFQTHENLEHLAMMECVFGKLPATMARQAQPIRPEWLRGTRLDWPQATTTRQSKKFVKGIKKLEDIIRRETIFQTRFESLLVKLLAWDPAKRMTVKEALRHSFFLLEFQDGQDSWTDPANARR